MDDMAPACSTSPENTLGTPAVVDRILASNCAWVRPLAGVGASNSKCHTQNDIIIYIAQWASFPLTMLLHEKGILVMPLHKPHDQEELQGITHHNICIQ